MRSIIVFALALIAAAGVAASARTEPASCKACGDHRKRCMANYPGPTCQIDYDICMKSCAKK